MSDSHTVLLTAIQQLGSDLHAGLATVRTEIGSMRSEHSTRLHDLGADIMARIADLTSQIAGLRGRVERLEEGQTAMRADQQALRADQQTLRADLMDRMDRLQDTLTRLQDDIAVNMGAADAAQRVNDNTREDLRALREQVTIMWRQLKAVEAQVRNLSGDA